MSVLGILTFPIFVISRFFRCLHCLVLPRLASRRGRVALYAIILYFLTTNSLVFMVYALL